MRRYIDSLHVHIVGCKGLSHCRVFAWFRSNACCAGAAERPVGEVEDVSMMGRGHSGNESDDVHIVLDHACDLM